MHKKQKVVDLAKEVLARQATSRAERTVEQAAALGVPPSSEDSVLPANGRKQERPG